MTGKEELLVDKFDLRVPTQQRAQSVKRSACPAGRREEHLRLYYLPTILRRQLMIDEDRASTSNFQFEHQASADLNRQSLINPMIGRRKAHLTYQLYKDRSLLIIQHMVTYVHRHTHEALYTAKRAGTT